MWGIKNWWMAVYLLIGTVWDVKKKEVPVWYLAAGTILVLIYQIFWREEAIVLLAFGAITGGIFFLLSRMTKQGLGYGDSWMILILGIYLGIWKLLVVLGIAFLCSAVIAGFGLAGKFLKRKSRIPFFPFLAIGYLGLYGW